MSPEYGRPCVKARKIDDRDAEAIAEAVTRPTMGFVALKIEEQPDMQTLHRIRDQLVDDHTSLMNQIGRRTGAGEHHPISTLSAISL